MDNQSPPWIATGDQPEWHGATPDAWRALAQNDFTHLPSMADLSFEQLTSHSIDPELQWKNTQIAFKCSSTAFHILLFRLGWRFIGLGLQQARNKDFHDPAISLVHQMLGPYELHLAQWANDQGFVGSILKGEPTLHELSKERNYFLTGGYDPLHLHVHLSSPIDDVFEQDGKSKTAELHVVGYHPESAAPRAIMEIEQYACWYSELARLGDGIGRAKGTIDVYCKPVGWLGTYRLSSHSNEWHATSEKIHRLGFPKMNSE
jgi:hypothetical protein